MVDTVDKVGRVALRRNNRIDAMGSLNQCYRGLGWFESILRARHPKILYQQYRPGADIRGRHHPENEFHIATPRPYRMENLDVL